MVVAISIVSQFAPPDIFFSLEAAVKLFESGLGDNSALDIPYCPPSVDEVEYPNSATPWPTMLRVRVRPRIDAETKSSFPATHADIESTYLITLSKPCTLS